MNKQYVYEVVDTGERFTLDKPPEPGKEKKIFKLRVNNEAGEEVLVLDCAVRYIGPVQ